MAPEVFGDVEYNLDTHCSVRDARPGIALQSGSPWELVRRTGWTFTWNCWTYYVFAGLLCIVAQNCFCLAFIEARAKSSHWLWFVFLKIAFCRSEFPQAFAWHAARATLCDWDFEILWEECCGWSSSCSGPTS